MLHYTLHDGFEDAHVACVIYTILQRYIDRVVSPLSSTYLNSEIYFVKSTMWEYALLNLLCGNTLIAILG